MAITWFTEFHCAVKLFTTPKQGLCESCTITKMVRRQQKCAPICAWVPKIETGITVLKPILAMQISLISTHLMPSPTSDFTWSGTMRIVIAKRHMPPLCSPTNPLATDHVSVSDGRVAAELPARQE